MRWNSKFEEKTLRYDGILCTDKIQPIRSKLFGVTGKYLKDDQNIYYINAILDGDTENEKIKKKNRDGKTEYKLFISDHFGVLSTFLFVS